MTREFIEVPAFTKEWSNIGLDDDDLKDLQDELIANPEKGSVIQGTGRARKVRIALPGRGKSGGGRVIYADVIIRNKVYLISVYVKNEKEDITEKEKKNIRELIKSIKEE